VTAAVPSRAELTPGIGEVVAAAALYSWTSRSTSSAVWTPAVLDLRIASTHEASWSAEELGINEQG
jgi:hypothetical protein